MRIFFQELDNGYTLIYDELMINSGFDPERVPVITSLVDKDPDQLDIYIYHPKLRSECHNANRRICVIIKSELIFVINAQASDDRFWQYDFMLWSIENQHSIKSIA
jgi:hypothetical protein